jgi:hypothetical protein
MAEQPMTKSEAVEWIRRTRQDLRDAERALQSGSQAHLLSAVRDAGGCMGELEAALSGPGYDD